MNKTKVVVTIGPASKEKSIIKELVMYGMDVARINLSHANHDFCRDIVNKINGINKELNTNVAIMLDTQGPDIRVGEFVGGSAYFRKGETVRIYKEDILGDSTKFSISYKGLHKDVMYNDIIKFNDGKVEMRVIDVNEEFICCEVLNNGYIYDNKGVNVPGVYLSRPFLSDKDKKDIMFANELDVDFLALSFVSNAEDVLVVNDLLIEIGNDHLKIISKIENEQSLNELDEIIKVSEGVMVARGDLGAELPPEKIPGIQKKIISKALAHGKISIVATEMMSSMEKSITPTRAEVSDVANAVLDGCDAVMLSGETTIGKYPLETVMMMEKIIKSAEEDIDYKSFLTTAMKTEKQDTTGLISYSAVECAIRLKAKAIVTPTMTGTTAKKISRFRPSCPILAISPDPKTVKGLALNFGIQASLDYEIHSFDKIMDLSVETAKEFLGNQKGEKIVITGGYPFNKTKHTNFLKIEEL